MFSFDEKTNQLYYGTKSCSGAFTLQEFKVLVHLLKKDGAVTSRDDIGEVLWGKNSPEKYSDWMIDKLISNIRKKLDNVGFPSEKLVTLKKRGFYLAQ